MTWEEVLKREDIVGGDLETQENGEVYRGPISKIELQGGKVYFDSPWTARMESNGSWENWHITRWFVDAELSFPQEIAEGRIQFQMPYLGFGVIFPKGGSRLDPARVNGLVL